MTFVEKILDKLFDRWCLNNVTIDKTLRMTCACGGYYKFANKKIYLFGLKNSPEHFIWIVNHETLHKILHKELNNSVSHALDSLPLDGVWGVPRKRLPKKYQNKDCMINKKKYLY